MIGAGIVIAVHLHVMADKAGRDFRGIIARRDRAGRRRLQRAVVHHNGMENDAVHAMIADLEINDLAETDPARRDHSHLVSRPLIFHFCPRKRASHRCSKR